MYACTYVHLSSASLFSQSVSHHSHTLVPLTLILCTPSLHFVGHSFPSFSPCQREFIAYWSCIRHAQTQRGRGNTQKGREARSKGVHFEPVRESSFVRGFTPSPVFNIDLLQYINIPCVIIIHPDQRSAQSSYVHM